MPRLRTPLALGAAALTVGIMSGWALLDPGPAPDDAPAAEAIRAARLGDAVRHAPATFSLAEEEYARGLQERRRQELRPRALRDYATAHRHLEDAGRHAVAATELAQKRTARMRRDAVRAVTEARVALATAEEADRTVWLPPSARREMARARMLVHEAESMAASGRSGDAHLRAASALSAARAVHEAALDEVTRFADPGAQARWNQWVQETVAWSARTGKPAIVVDKDRHRMWLYEGGRVVRTYDIDLGWSNARDKLHQGDGATPEGRYRVSQKKGRGQSRYHKALLLDYPNASDLEELRAAKKAGRVAAGVPAGGLIEIHGDGGRGTDWTDGCVAVTNAEMDEIFRRVEVGTPVTVVGSRGEGAFTDLVRRLR